MCVCESNVFISNNKHRPRLAKWISERDDVFFKESGKLGGVVQVNCKEGNELQM